MYTDTQLNRDAESHYDLAQDRHDEEGARQDWRTARVAEIAAPMIVQKTLKPTGLDQGYVLASVSQRDCERLAQLWATDRLKWMREIRACVLKGFETLAEDEAEGEFQKQEMARQAAPCVRLWDEE